MAPLRARLRGDRGETLAEVLVAIVILGLAGVAVVGGLGLAVKSSDIHRKETTGGAYVKSFAEAIETYVGTSGATNYKPCAATDAYQVPAVMSRLSLPAGFTATQDAAKAVGPTGALTGCATDTGIQQVTLHVSSADHRATESLTIVLRDPCDPSVVTPCTS